MTIDEFKEMINREAAQRMGLRAFANYVRRNDRSDKYLKEEYLPVLAVVQHLRLQGTDTIELGNETHEWDARVNGTDLYEVVQALPDKEHEIRRSTAGDARTAVHGVDPETGEAIDEVITGLTAQILLQMQHAYDQFQFPKAIINAIETYFPQVRRGISWRFR